MVRGGAGVGVTTGAGTAGRAARQARSIISVVSAADSAIRDTVATLFRRCLATPTRAGVRKLSPKARSRMKRVVAIVIDSGGVGALADAADYGDAPGADTLGNVARRMGGLTLPNFESL